MARREKAATLMRILKAGALYFAIVFGVGFVMGTIRVFWMVPMFGSRVDELVEIPVLLAVVIITARLIVEKLRVPANTAARAGMGLVALGLLLAAEWMLATGMRGLTIGEYITTRDPVAGGVYLAMLVVVAAMPLVVGRGQTG
jgi:hypothetical protein